MLPATMWGKAIGLMQHWFGNNGERIQTAARGLFHLPECAKWGDAAVHFDSRADGHRGVEKEYCVVELPSSALGLLPDHAAILQLCRSLLKMGGRCSRCDLAADWLDGAGVGLIRRIIKACKAGEHVGCKRWEPRESFGVFQQHVGEGVNLGLRGKNGSGRYVRVYDKGLEQESHKRGEWVRWELEATQEVARDVMLVLVDALDLGDAIAEIAFGAVDFKDNPAEKNVGRRPRSKWWARRLPSPEVRRIRARRPASTIAGYAKWLSSAVVPTLCAFACATNTTWGELAERLGWGGELKPEAIDKQVGRELMRFLEETAPGTDVHEWYAATCEDNTAAFARFMAKEVA